MTRRASRYAVAGVALATALALAAPFFPIASLNAPVRAALERALGRRVEIGGPLRFRLLPSPAVIVENAVISDEAAFGIEPFAYVPELEISLDPFGLLRGRMTFRGLTLVEPSMNLVKNAEGEWNYPGLLQRLFAAPASGRALLPRIDLRAGRLNFKFGDRKSVFYLSDADIAVGPEPGKEPALRFRFSASPSRTDRAAQGFGRFSGNGRFVYSKAGEHRLRMVVRLERSAIPELLTLFGGYGAGLGGFLASRAEFEGPLSRVRIRGELQLAEVDQRFILPPRSGEWALNYEGTLDLIGQEVRLRTRPRRERLPVSIRFFAGDYLSRPRWAIVAATDRLQLETIPALASELGVPLFTGLKLQGWLSGAVGRSADGRIQGRFRVTDVDLSAPGGQRVHVAAATITALDDVLSVAPAPILVEGREAATVSGSYSRTAQELNIIVGSRQFPIERFVSFWEAMARSEAPRAFRLGSGGHWTGILRFRGTPEGEFWSGNIVLSDRRLAVPGIDGEVRLVRAETDALGREVRLDARVGGITVKGRWAEPDRLDLNCSEAAIEDLEKLLHPSLSWGPTGLIARTLRLRRGKPPKWLAHRHVKGTFTAQTVTAGPARLTGVAARYYWNGPSLEIHLDHASTSPGSFAGALHVDLTKGQPRWTASGSLRGFLWDGAELQAVGSVETQGAGVEAIASLRGEGEFAARFVEPAAGIRAASGCFEVHMAGFRPQFVLPCLRLATRGRGVLDGWGRVDTRGRIRLRLFDARRWYEASGRLVPLELAVRPGSPRGIE